MNAAREIREAVGITSTELYDDDRHIGSVQRIHDGALIVYMAHPSHGNSTPHYTYEDAKDVVVETYEIWLKDGAK